MRRFITLAIGFAVSAFFVWLGFRELHLDEVVSIVRELNFAWLLLAAVVYQFAAYIITWRWYFLLHPVKVVHPHQLFPIVMIGYTGNNIYPARIGEFVRAYLLRRDEGIPYAPSLATIVVERIFDGLVMMVFIIVALAFVRFDDPVIDSVLTGLAPLFFGGLLLFSFFALRPQLTRRVYSLVVQRLVPARFQARVLEIAEHFMRGLQTLRSPRLLLLTWLSSAATWIVEASTYWIVLQAFDFRVTFWVLLLVVGLANLTTILPSTPGYFGTFHGAVVLILTAFDVPGEQAGAYAIVMHLVLWLPVTLLGAGFLWYKGIRWRDLNRATQAVEREAMA